ncbi:Phosphate binding protein [Candidatus Magnetoovum chiemensis]|nr:Phosphate binding protein [Candidatus Magnetoovum chiemensis]
MEKMRFALFIFILLFPSLLATSLLSAAEIDKDIPNYEKASGVSGSINSIGSDTMNNLMTLWCEGFSRYYPNVKCQIEGKGSSTAPAALINATAQIGPMSRQMKTSEIDEFEKKFGYKPYEIKTSLDSIGVYVNKDNPIKGLTLEEIDAIFSKNLLCGMKKSIDKWGDLSLEGKWADRPISLYGRNSASGTYAFFKEHSLCKGDYKDTVKEHPGSASVVQGITEDLYGIGYSGIGYKTSGVRVLPLAQKGSKTYVEPTIENLLNGSYPLGRFLYIYINKAPNKPLEPLVKEFVKFIMSKEGQEVVIKDGYFAIPAKIALDQLNKLEQ